MTTLEQLQRHLETESTTYPWGLIFKKAAPMMICKDGSTLSVQASDLCYCTPYSNTGPWTHVEVRRIKGAPKSWDLYKVVSECFAYVPIEMVADEIDRRGGFSAQLIPEEPNQ